MMWCTTKEVTSECSCQVLHLHHASELVAAVSSPFRYSEKCCSWQAESSKRKRKNCLHITALLTMRCERRNSELPQTPVVGCQPLLLSIAFATSRITLTPVSFLKFYSTRLNAPSTQYPSTFQKAACFYLLIHISGTTVPNAGMQSFIIGWQRNYVKKKWVAWA